MINLFNTKKLVELVFSLSSYFKILILIFFFIFTFKENFLIIHPGIGGWTYEGEYETYVNNTPVMDCYMEGDICCRGEDFESKTSWDSLSYVLLMAHNVYQQIEAVQEANRRTDDKDVKSIPENVLEFVDLTKQVFQSEKPIEMIEKNSSLLNSLSKAKFSGAPRTTTFDNLVESVPELVQKEKKVVKETVSNFDTLFE